jgi:hypothetical protein
MYWRSQTDQEVAVEGVGGHLECSDIPADVVVGDELGAWPEDAVDGNRNRAAIADNIERMLLMAGRKLQVGVGEALGQRIVGRRL